MQLNMNKLLIAGYKSIPQQIRVLTEDWFLNEAYCPSCGENVEHYEANKPVADFYCKRCKEDFELKSKHNELSNRIVDGAYRTMKERLESNNNPNFFFMTYRESTVENLILIPKHFFVMDIIEKRKPLSLTARRAGWVGCNILLNNIPDSGKIYYIKDRKISDKRIVARSFKKTLFLKDVKVASAKGWILDVMKCVERLNRKQFKLDEIYGFEKYLAKLHPDNKNIKPKIRQQLQQLRDKGYLRFDGGGRYTVAE